MWAIFSTSCAFHSLLVNLNLTHGKNDDTDEEQLCHTSVLHYIIIIIAVVVIIIIIIIKL